MSTGMRYRYRASSDRGEIVDGVAEAGSRRQLLDQLRRRNLHALTVEEIAPAGELRARSAGRHQAVVRWARSFAALLGAAIPLDRALAVSAGQCRHEGLASVLGDVRESVQAGEALSEALARHPSWFPAVMPAMAKAGEASGASGEAFEQIADYLEEVDELRAQVRSALLYPALMAAVATLGVVVLLLFVVPRFSVILEDLGGSLPFTTQVLVWTGHVMVNFWWLFLLAAAAAAFGLRNWMARPANRLRWHRSRLAWPVMGDLESKLIASRFTRTLGLLLTHGLPLLPSLRIALAGVGNVHTERLLSQAVANVAEGGSLAEGMGGALPSLAVEMLAVGEESGRLDTMCARVANTYDREVRRSLKTAISLMEPAMIVAFGALVGFVALAMLQAIYSVNTNLG